MSEGYSGPLGLVAGGTCILKRAASVAFFEEGATVAVTYRRQNEFEDSRHSAVNASDDSIAVRLRFESERPLGTTFFRPSQARLARRSNLVEAADSRCVGGMRHEAGLRGRFLGDCAHGFNEKVAFFL